MDHDLEVEVFRAGDYGPRGNYSEEDLDRMARDYSPSVHEAPVTLDHQQEGPAVGWIRSLRRMGKVLVARLGGLDAAFLDQLHSGAFKKRSVELYRAAQWTGRPYLRALSFLGACPPAVKGLADPIFADRESTDATDRAWIDFDETADPQSPAVPQTVSFEEKGEGAPDAATEEWCERGLLARIHRYTLNRRRRELEPVSAATSCASCSSGIASDRPGGPKELAVWRP